MFPNPTTDEGVAVWCDDLPGCCSQGETRTAAVANIKEAIREYMAARRELEVVGGAKVLHDPINAFTMGQIAKGAGLTPDDFKQLL